MIIKKTVLAIATLFILIFGGYTLYQYFLTEPKQTLFTTEKVSRRDITQEIKASGSIDVQEMMKIGSLVSGVIEKMYVAEGDTVTKGQLIALVDDGNADTIIRQNKALLEGAQADLTYQTAFLKRQKALYETNNISRDVYEQAIQQYEISQANVNRTQAQFDKATIDFNNQEIKAPDEGLVIEKVASIGETVSLTSPPTLIYTIAKDITKMETSLEIDESVVGNVTLNTPVTITFDTYPDKRFEGVINTISQAPIKQANVVAYSALVEINNTERLFRPKMTVNARIIIGKKENVLSVPVHVFKISAEILASIARIQNMQFLPMDEDEKKLFLKQEKAKTIWTYADNSFIEKPIIAGISNNAFIEIVSGLDEHDEIISDTIESDGSEKFYQKIFGKGL